MKYTVPIKKNTEFLRIYKKGKFFVGKFLVLYVYKNNSRVNRLGITASRKFGKSVQRNRIRRLIKENYRLMEEFLKTGYDLVFVARSSEEVPDYVSIKKEMKYL
ncbi:MAG: ribonuclease P protein component, partial [Clostridiaceae bacterium]|nr:ribonuclease P protein component [Clostridiaceae bacterium]